VRLVCKHGLCSGLSIVARWDREGRHKCPPHLVGLMVMRLEKFGRNTVWIIVALIRAVQSDGVYYFMPEKKSASR
jgi:hypothetical protein